MTSRPNVTYYQRCVGRWRCAFDLRVTDPEVLRANLGWLDRIGVHLASRWPRWLPRLWFETSVAVEADGGVLHTTTVRWLGLPFITSTETLELHPDGHRFTLRGRTRVLMAPWRSRPVDGVGEVDAEAVHATYDLVWLGAPLRQSTERTDDVVTLAMVGSGFAGTQRLERQTSRGA